ncbi:DUF2264 domain-containing protein [Enterococcus gilvus]|uniref:DUF2264 domain-containing protein n=1 Tax=Enterococcus gilvus TaxID=160453 RepID=UPI001C8B49EB|nr:DUF2264 domain-containing protein [Enterococcus gilvus]MBX8935380.1 DUF2264 domain-containing protein [Enterococcus gilvus]
MEKLRENTFLTRRDYQAALEGIIQPIRAAILDSDKAGLNLGSSGAVYDRKRSEMEALIRPLWGIAPYWSSCQDNELRDAYVEKVIQGTNPAGNNYWGEMDNYDQYIVESAALALTLLLHKDYFWEQIPKKNQQYLIDWLSQALTKRIPKNNWTFFKVLIRVALYRCGVSLDKEELKKELELIDSMYIGDGWYVDGKTTQRDYYVPFAFHYYGLIYSTVMREEDPEWSKRFIDRAVRFAQDFVYYFDEAGEALPYGRSQTYRFAQGAFFSALVFADVEAIPWGEVKTLLSKHLSSWINHDIFTFDGRLSIGYHYENLVMAEGYNAPGSPYWALKTFLLLAVKENHPFWSAEPAPIQRENKKLIGKGNMLLLHEQAGRHLLGYPAGMMIENQAHAQSKYSKFVYSSRFGFSVPKAGYSYEEGAFDSNLAVSRDGEYYRIKGNVNDFKLTKEAVYYQWSPFGEVQIETEIYPFGQWHLRVHEIDTAIPLEIREGGFSVPLSGRKPKGETGSIWAKVSEAGLISQIVAVEGYDQALLIQPEVNTSLFFPRTTLPCLTKKIPAGKHRLICLVGGILTESDGEHDKN